MIQTAFLEAVVNRRHSVLGRPLHAFCLYDALFLSLAGNALWIGGTPTRPALEEAVLICSLPPERFLHCEIRPPTRLGRFARKLWHLRSLRLPLAPQLTLWQTYLADFTTGPTHWDTDDDAAPGRPLRAPGIYSLVCFIEQYSNMAEREIMTAPYGLMLWKAETIAERNGLNVGEIMTEEEIETGAEQSAAMAAAEESAASSEPSTLNSQPAP